MTDALNFFVASVIMLAGIVVGGSGAFTEAPEDFSQTHPIDGDWLQSGNFDNLQSSQGVLSIDDTSQGYGVFESYLFHPAEEFTVERVIFNASQIRESKDQVVNVTLYGYRDNAVTATSNILIDTEIRTSVTTSEVFNESKEFTGYAFVANLTTDGSTSPELREFTVEGTGLSGNNTVSQGIMWLLFGIGLLMVVRELGK
jgi:hypothetical protein